jgi:hypothetical protein
VQPILEQLQEDFASVRVVAFPDDSVSQGPLQAVQSAYDALWQRLADVKLMIQQLNCKLYFPDSKHAATLGFQLDITHALQRLVVAGCPVSEAGLIQQHTAESVTRCVPLRMPMTFC